MPPLLILFFMYHPNSLLLNLLINKMLYIENETSCVEKFTLKVHIYLLIRLDFVATFFLR